MITTLYRIPDRYFPGVFVKKPFHAKVNYEVKNGQVKIYDVCLSPLCLMHIRDTDKMIIEMDRAIADADKKRLGNMVNETIMNAIAPHI